MSLAIVIAEWKRKFLVDLKKPTAVVRKLTLKQRTLNIQRLFSTEFEERIFDDGQLRHNPSPT